MDNANEFIVERHFERNHEYLIIVRREQPGVKVPNTSYYSDRTAREAQVVADLLSTIWRTATIEAMSAR